MARKESQGLQIAMIVFVITTLVLLVTTYLFWSQSQKLTAENEKLSGDLSNANDSVRTSESQNVELKQYLGLVPEEDYATAKTGLDDAKKVYAQGLPPERQNFQDIAVHLNGRIQTLTKELSDAQRREQALIAEKNDIRKQEETIVNDARTAEGKAASDLESERAAYQEARAKANKRLTDLDKEINTKQRELTSLRAETDKQLAEVRLLMKQKDEILTARTEELNRIRGESEFFDVADGKILAAVPATRTVWLNMGEADGLRPKITFSVYDAAEFNLATAPKKGNIEVTKILGDHVAEARILEADYDYTNPIIQDDFIYSPLWSPGAQLGVALVGKMDLDGDDRDDRELVRNLVLLNGGRIDAEDVNGKVRGEITVDTRYLIRGDTSIGERDDANPAVKPMLDAATQLGVEQMSVDKLARSLGYAGRARTVSFDGAGNPSDFLAKPKEGVNYKSPGSTRYRP